MTGLAERLRTSVLGLRDYVVAGLCLEPFVGYWVTALQREFSPHQLARVTSIDRICSFAPMPLGLALTGPAVATLGEDVVLWTGAVVVALTPLLLLVPGMLDFREPRLAASTPSDGGAVEVLPGP